MIMMPESIEKWTEFRKGSGKPFLKEGAPKSVKDEAAKWERKYYEATGRRRIVNIELTAH